MKSLEHDKPTPQLKMKRIDSLGPDDLDLGALLDPGQGQGPDHDQGDEVEVDLSLPMPMLDRYPTMPMDPVAMTTNQFMSRIEVEPPKPRVEGVLPKRKLLEAMMDFLLVYYLLYSTIKVEVGEGTMKLDRVDRGADELKVQLEVEGGIGV